MAQASPSGMMKVMAVTMGHILKVWRIPQARVLRVGTGQAVGACLGS